MRDSSRNRVLIYTAIPYSIRRSHALVFAGVDISSIAAARQARLAPDLIRAARQLRTACACSNSSCEQPDAIATLIRRTRLRTTAPNLGQPQPDRAAVDRGELHASEVVDSAPNGVL